MLSKISLENFRKKIGEAQQLHVPLVAIQAPIAKLRSAEKNAKVMIYLKFSYNKVNISS